jgi:hypothetical protein
VKPGLERGEARQSDSSRLGVVSRRGVSCLRGEASRLGLEARRGEGLKRGEDS